MNRDNRQQFGFIYLVPVFRDGTDPTSPPQRRAAMTGLLYAPIIATEVLAGAAKQEDDALNFQLSVRGTAGQDDPLFDSITDTVVTQLGKVSAATRAGQSFRENRQFEVGSRSFTLIATFHPGLRQLRQPVGILVARRRWQLDQHDAGSDDLVAGGGSRARHRHG